MFILYFNPKLQQNSDIEVLNTEGSILVEIDPSVFFLKVRDTKQTSHRPDR
ncbi:MAG: hypothetical protein JNL70_25875 [Saprospiraceae bacterium]|nr:hypothetical protein [Saprospiraceae bacterium]